MRFLLIGIATVFCGKAESSAVDHRVGIAALYEKMKAEGKLWSDDVFGIADAGTKYDEMMANALKTSSDKDLVASVNAQLEALFGSSDDGSISTAVDEFEAESMQDSGRSTPDMFVERTREKAWKKFERLLSLEAEVERAKHQIIGLVGVEGLETFRDELDKARAEEIEKYKNSSEAISRRNERAAKKGRDEIVLSDYSAFHDDVEDSVVLPNRKSFKPSTAMRSKQQADARNDKKYSKDGVSSRDEEGVVRFQPVPKKASRNSSVNYKAKNRDKKKREAGH